MRIIKFQTHGDEKGTLVAVEECKDIPFQIKRVYYMYNTGSDVSRGCHAHKSLQQVLICVHGSCKVRLDDGKERKVVSLDQPDKGLYISNHILCIYDYKHFRVLRMTHMFHSMVYIYYH